MPKISLQEMMEAGVHYGHQTRRWNPKMKPFIFRKHNGIYILNLQKALPLVAKACIFMVKTVAEGGSVLFVGTKKQAQASIRAEAQRCHMYSVTNRWLGGMLTNFKTIRSGIDRLKKIETMQADGTFEQLLKKERMRLTKEKAKLETTFLGIKDMGRLPSAVFIVDPKKEHIAVEEALRLKIPIVAIVDTNCNPDQIDHIIPGNDDASRSIALITSWIADSCLEGLNRRDERIAEEIARGDISLEEISGKEEKGEDGLVVTRRKKPRKKSGEENDDTLNNAPPQDSAIA